MIKRHLIALGMPVLILAGALVGYSASGTIASASTLTPEREAKVAATSARKAAKALAAQHTADAIGFAETAVGFAPRSAAYRSILGRAYLANGRFVSARTTLAEALELDPSNGRTALDLAIAIMATGDAPGGRQLLNAYRQRIAPGDLGLALTLAGDPADGVGVLTQAARAGQGTPTLRQNLALAYALGGQWQIARLVISADMPSDQVDARLEQWAALARPDGVTDRIAAVLGVQPVADAGRPIALALNAPVPVVPGPALEAASATTTPPTVVTVALPAPVRMIAAPAFAAPIIRVAAPEIVQHVATIRPLPVAAKVAIRRQTDATPAGIAPAPGNWFVQIGAYESAAIAHDGWNRAVRRMPALASHRPNGSAYRSRAGMFYRLSVGGFARGDADRLCRSLRARSTSCFVRPGAGDQLASWARPGVQFASR